MPENKAIKFALFFKVIVFLGMEKIPETHVFTFALCFQGYSLTYNAKWINFTLFSQGFSLAFLWKKCVKKCSYLSTSYQGYSLPWYEKSAWNPRVFFWLFFKAVVLPFYAQMPEKKGIDFKQVLQGCSLAFLCKNAWKEGNWF